MQRATRRTLSVVGVFAEMLGGSPRSASRKPPRRDGTKSGSKTSEAGSNSLTAFSSDQAISSPRLVWWPKVAPLANDWRRALG